MTDYEFMLSVLEKAWRSEVRMAGRGTVERLISASATGKLTDHTAEEISDSGTPYDVQLILNTLTVAIAFVNLCIKVVATCRKKGASEEEAKEELTAALVNNERLQTFAAGDKADMAFRTVYSSWDGISAS